MNRLFAQCSDHRAESRRKCYSVMSPGYHLLSVVCRGNPGGLSLGKASALGPDGPATSFPIPRQNCLTNPSGSHYLEGH